MSRLSAIKKKKIKEMSTAAAADSSFIKCSIKELKSQNGRITAPEENIPSIILQFSAVPWCAVPC